MSEVLIWSLEQSRKQTLSLVEDLRDEQMCLQTSAKELKQNGWRVLTIWECEIKNEDKLKHKLLRFLIE